MKIWQTFDYPGIENKETVSEELILENLRIKRQKLLYDCDWTQLPDSQSDRVKWAEYRQKLRDLPASGLPKDLEWPISPNQEPPNE